MTVMGGSRVLQFGYPKAHDGRNVFYDLQHTDKRLGLDEETGAYVGGAGWGQYYIAALAIKLAETTDDLYERTAIIRSFFAFFGFSGLVLLGLTGACLFSSAASKKKFLITFSALELFSVPLVLHLREARYYPLTVFLAALLIYLFVRYRIQKKTGYKLYSLLSFTSLVFIFLVFSPAYFILLSAVCSFEAAAVVRNLVRRKNRIAFRSGISETSFGYHLKNILPLLLSAIPVIPMMIFFDVLNISARLSEYYAWGLKTDRLGLYLDNLSFIWNFFAASDLIYFALLVKIAVVAALIKDFSSGKELRCSPLFLFSFFLTLVTVFYFLLIAKMPSPLYTRYFIPLQPVLALLILADLALISEFPMFQKSGIGFLLRRGLYACFLLFVCFNAYRNTEFIKGHLYELTYAYRGPLDYVIPFIKRIAGDTDRLVIATNYEETSFMYYLGAKATIGFAGNNLKEDRLLQPDVIVYRKWWNNFRPEFQNFIQAHPYQEISFPVFDSPVNNIPELHHPAPIRHQFRTREVEEEWLKTYIFLKKG